MNLPIFDTPDQIVAAQRIIEEETAERYLELGDAFELHGNAPAGDTFRELGRQAELRAEALSSTAHPLPSGFSWPLMDDVVVEQSMLHYLMGPYQVIELAIEGRQRALSYFEGIAAQAASEDRVEEQARQVMAAFSAQLEVLRQRLAETPPPEPGWDEDLDPPNFDVE